MIRSPSQTTMKVRNHILKWGERTFVMGIVNASPDSFSGDGVAGAAAVDHALRQLQNGADILDVGGESTRPGHVPVSAETELTRVIPVIEAIRRQSDAIISIDTTKPAVLKAAIQAGADILNSIWGLERRLTEVVAEERVPVVIMHNKAEAKYDGDVLDEVIAYLERSAAQAISLGLSEGQIMLDPGIGFGKLPEHNLQILSDLHRIKQLGFPLLIGTSRKSTIGLITGKPASHRAFGTAATIALAIEQGADIVRVHDVEDMIDVVKVSDAIVRRNFALRRPQTEVSAAIAIGSNMGDPFENVRRAITMLERVGKVERVSSLYTTRPWGYTDQSDFVNAVAMVSLKCSPQELLIQLQQLEQELGRTSTFRWGPRVIDLDIITFGDEKVNAPGLQIPHPGLSTRAFVLIPLAEIAPEYAAMLVDLPEEDRAGVIRTAT